MNATHYIGNDQFAACGTWACCATTSTTDRTAVTCKRCLASLAKRDREFQRKARKAFQVVRLPGGGIVRDTLSAGSIRSARRVACSGDAARAIAREEGRAL